MEGLQRGMTLGNIPSSTACQIFEDILQNCNSQFLPKFVHQNVSKIQQAKFSLTDTDTETSGWNKTPKRCKSFAVCNKMCSNHQTIFFRYTCSFSLFPCDVRVDRWIVVSNSLCLRQTCNVQTCFRGTK